MNFNSNFELRRAIYFTYLESLGNVLYRSSKGIYYRYDITDIIQKDNCYVGKICSKYRGISFSYGIFTPNPRELDWAFLFEILHFKMVFRGIGLSKLFRLIFG